MELVALDPSRADMMASYGILDTPADPSFDDLVYLAADLCEAPISTISLIDTTRQWFKAKVGVEACETDLESSVCKHGLTSEGLLIIPDLKRDERTAENPVVTGKPPLRFYAGAPLRTSSGDTLGMLCVADNYPRPNGLTQRQQRGLTALGRAATTAIELHKLVRERDQLLRAMTAR